MFWILLRSFDWTIEHESFRLYRAIGCKLVPISAVLYMLAFKFYMAFVLAFLPYFDISAAAATHASAYLSRCIKSAHALFHKTWRFWVASNKPNFSSSFHADKTFRLTRTRTFFCNMSGNRNSKKNVFKLPSKFRAVWQRAIGAHLVCLGCLIGAAYRKCSNWK